MATSNRPRVPVPVTGLLLGVLTVGSLGGLTACGDDTTSTGPTTTSSSADLPDPSPATTAAQAGTCPDVITATAIADLGWDSTAGAVEGRGGCFWEGDEGTVTVFESGQDYAQACRRIEAAAPEGTFEPELDAADGTTACGFVRSTDVGGSELAVDRDGQVVSITVAALRPTSPDQVRAALVALSGSLDAL